MLKKIIILLIKNLCLDLPVDKLLLENGEQVVDEPVEHHSRGHLQADPGEDDGHEHHDLCLAGIACNGGQLLLQEHGCTHENGCYVKWVLG